MSINKACISGNLGRDPELRASASGTAVCQFSVCVSDRRKNRQGEWEDVPNWVDVAFFGSRAESIHKHLAKGSLVFVSGRLHQSTWEARDGQRRSKLEIVGDDIHFGGGGSQGRQRPARPEPQPGFGCQDQPGFDASAGAYDEEIPF